MAAQPESTTAGNINYGLQKVEKQSNVLNLYSSKETSIRIETFNIEDPLDIDEDEDRTLSELHNEIQDRNKSDLKDKKINSFIWPITGVAGSGKTQYALKYVYKYKREYAHCLLINASTVENAQESFLDTENDLKAKGITEIKKDACVENVYNSTLTNHSLIVFDDIDCGTNFMKTDFGKFFPPTLKTDWKQPVIIVTSKNRDWEEHKNCRSSWKPWRPTLDIVEEVTGYKDPIEYFVGRTDVLNTVQSTFEEAKENTEVSSHLVILIGMPGIGKSETARMYVNKRKADYGNIIWINAKTQELIFKSFSEVSRKLQLPFQNLETLKKDTKGLAREVYKELCQMSLLIVFDGANSWSSEDGIRNFIPMDIKRGWKTPDIIVTSRNRNWGTGKVIEVEELCFEDCHKLLSCLLNRHAHKDTWILSFLVYWRYGGLPIVAQQFVLNYDRSSQSQIAACKEYFNALCNYKNFLNTPVFET
ncbi:unnamed protein product [Allacma fusca]|uniref:NB-ARC domain-containing protein n=1 Tax=Allacma fusca TaxID=39272 RepID=A0A8J2KVP1_9HEXA|nr:unnamed protein product [Allacma fusca]